MRVSSSPIEIPANVEWQNIDGQLNFKSNKGEMFYQIPAKVDLVESEGKIWFAPKNLDGNTKALAGTTRANVNNIIIGLTQGFEKKLELKGIGYRAKIEGKTLVLTLGKSHLDYYDAPDGISITTPSQTEIVVSGINKAMVCQVAAEIRAFRPPESYKGKGIRYAGEHIKLKEVNK